MAQRNSGHDRIEDDAYFTPAWVTYALVPHIPRRVKQIWEPACGDGAIVNALSLAGYDVTASDLKTGTDFLKMLPPTKASIVTNPPYKHAQEFIERSLYLTARHRRGIVAMLLRIDFDSALTRRYLFADLPSFSKKIVLLARVRWIPDSTGSPSENHAWYIWDWLHRGPPHIVYAEEDRCER